MRSFSANWARTSDNLEQKFGPLPGGPWNDSPRCGLVVPITLVDQRVPTALLVAGISPRRQLDDAYREFLDSVSRLLAATFMRVQAYQSLAVREIVDLIPVMIRVIETGRYRSVREQGHPRLHRVFYPRRDATGRHRSQRSSGRRKPPARRAPKGDARQ